MVGLHDGGIVLSESVFRKGRCAKISLREARRNHRPSKLARKRPLVMARKESAMAKELKGTAGGGM